MKKSFLLTASLLMPAAVPATASVLASTTAQDTATTAQGAATSEFGAPVIVNGEQISDMAIKRFLVYGPGRNALDARKLQILMDHERELRVSTETEAAAAEFPDADEATLAAAVAERMKAFEVDMRAVNRRLAEEKASFEERYPTLDHEVELRRAYGSGDWYRAQVQQTMEFDALFFPNHPDTWPELSLEAIYAGSPQVDLVADYAKEYERRLKVSMETGEAIIPEQEMMMGLLRDFVMQALWSLAEVKTGTQGIPERLAMTIDGGDWNAEVLTQDVYDEMKASFSGQDIEDAKLCLALLTAARQKLSENQQLMGEEEFVTMISNLRSQMANTMFNMDFLALQGHGFPSPEAYETHLRLVESYKQANLDKIEIAEDGTIGPELTEHMTVANGIMGLAKAHADVLLVSAFDFPNFEWKQKGWDEAYDRAYALRGEVDAYLAALAADRAASAKAAAAGEDYAPEVELLPFDRWWTDFLRSSSDYWDPPLPVSGKQPPAIGLKNFGAFQGSAMTRNDMKRSIGESEYEHFLSNSAVVDTIFFEMEPGTVGGPFRGPKGYYLVYLKSRSAPTNPLNMRVERHRSMIQEDWVRKSFQSFCHEALAAATVSGL